MANLVQSWKFVYYSNNQIETIALPNGEKIPLPPREMWLLGAKVTVSLMETEGTKSYRVTMTKDLMLGNETEHEAALIESAVIKAFGPGEVAKKFAARLIGGFAGGVVGGVIGGVLAPSAIASERFWRTKTESDIPVTVVLLGF